MLIQFVSYACAGTPAFQVVQNEITEQTVTAEIPIVYMTKEITPESLMKIYEALNRKASGKVGIKVSTGEPGGNNFLKPALIGDFVKSVNGIITECNTAYGGRRASTASHLQAAKDHGFTEIANIDIMDAEGDVEIPVNGGKHIKADKVGKNFLTYDFTVILSHFKGHAMGGFGGAVKNMSIGIASSGGKARIHSAGKNDNNAFVGTPQNDFLESMIHVPVSILTVFLSSWILVLLNCLAL